MKRALHAVVGNVILVGIIAIGLGSDYIWWH
jgi:hypothetical protein